MSKKIYITYKQIETLCFSKIIFISDADAQLDLNRSKKHYEFAVFIDEKDIVKEKEHIVLFFSSIIKIEIPKSEFNLFKNQFKLPLGLLDLANRNIPKDKNPEITEHDNAHQIIELYSRLRRSFTQLVLFGYKKNNQKFQTNLSKFLNKITNISTFEAALIKNINEVNCFPQLVTKETKPEEYYKFVWSGKFIINEILINRKDKIPDEDFQAHRSWLKDVEWQDLSKNLKHFKNIPSLFREHSGVIFGYFIAALSNNNLNKINIECEVDNLGIGNKYEVLFWGVLFKAFFVEELDYSYPNPLIQEDFFKMETLSYSIAKKLLNNNEDKIENDFTFKAIDSDNLVTSFYRLKEKRTKIAPIILDESELKKPSKKSLLFGENKEKIGFINERIGKASYLIIDEEGFELRSKITVPPVVFYGKLLTEKKESLKKSGVNIKIQDISTLISKESKVLIAFLSSYIHGNTLLNIYKNIIKSKKTRIEEFIFIWLVSKDNKTLHSPEFAFEKDNLKKEVELEFGLKTTVIVKNLYNESAGDIEVVRNLKLALKNYRANNIEVIDHNFKEEHASWLIAAIKDYIVKSKNVDYFSFSD